MKQVEIYTDGACSNNPGTGGWASVLKYKKARKEISGGELETTNNRMELTAVIKALETLKEPCKVTLYTDSKYISDAINKNWVYSWRKLGWRNSNNKPTPNVDLWKKLLHLLEIHEVKFVWVKGHSGNVENERCDTLAVEACNKMILNK